MNHVPVESSHISSIAYDEKSESLEVKFKNGDTYRYAGVPKEQHNKLMHARSVGGYFHAAVNGVYKSIKI